MSYIHNHNIAHRDLKLDNMLIDDNLNIKVLDFGLAYKGDCEALYNWVGTPSYMAPEINEQKFYNGTEVDIFSMGVILYSIVVGKFPFERATANNDFYSLIKNGQIEKFFELSGTEGLSAEFKDLISKMLAYEGSQRPTIEEIRTHPWMCQDDIKVCVSV